MLTKKESGKPRKLRKGAVTGARIAQLLREEGPMPARSIAMDLGMDESYVRVVCWQLTQAGLLTAKQHPQPGTRAITVFAVV